MHVSIFGSFATSSTRQYSKAGVIVYVRKTSFLPQFLLAGYLSIVLSSARSKLTFVFDVLLESVWLGGLSSCFVV